MKVKISQEIRDEYFDQEGHYADDATIINWLYEESLPDTNCYRPSLSKGKEQVGGSHYEELPIQPWKIITANKLDYFEGNVLKYLLRHKKKNGKQDIEKAIHYLTEMMCKYDELYGVKL